MSGGDEYTGDEYKGVKPGNPILNTLGPKRFETTVHFYEADQELNANDRKEIADRLKPIVFRTAFATYGTSFTAFCAPLLYYRFLAQPTTRRRPFMYRPFLSLFLGLSAMLITGLAVSGYLFNSEIAKVQESGNSRQLKVWETMDYRQASLFYLYYLKSSEDSRFVLNDPRSATKDLVMFHPEAKNENTQTSAWDKIRAATTKNDE